MTESNVNVKALIRQMQEEFNRTRDTLYVLPQAYLEQPCGHQCARGGPARDLLVHNIFHEKQHTGQIWSIRDQLRMLQGWCNADLHLLLADYYMARSHFIASLFRLTDEQLDAISLDGWLERQKDCRSRTARRAQLG
jgi:hypothetical protein